MDDNEDDILHLEDEVEDNPDLDLDGEEAEDQDAEGEQQPGEPEGFDIQIDGEIGEEEQPVIRQLRTRIKDLNKEVAELRAPAALVELGKKPDLWDDCEGDPDRFEVALNDYNKRKRDIEQSQAKEAEQRQQQDRVWQQEFATYKAKAAALPVPDYAAAEDTVVGVLPQILQNAIVKYAKDPAKVVYALAKHPAKLNALAEEADPVRFILAMRELEDKIVVNRRTPPAPEAPTIQRGSASLSGGSDKVLNKLMADAEKSGDFSKVVSHKAKGGRK